MQALSNLSPSIHFVGYGCVLSLGVDGEKFKGSGDICNFARQWMVESNPDGMKYIGPEAASVCRALAGSAERNQALSASALLPLRTMISKCQPSPEHMTPAHAAALKAALGAKKYYTGQQILAQPLYLLDTATGLTATDYLLYCYYGALVWIGCKEYAKASDLLLLAVTTPTSVPDAIVVAAWNKYLLVHALRTGNVAEPPKHTPYPTARQLKEHANILQFVKAYSNGNVGAMKTALEAEAAELKEEGVFGLAQQLYDKVVTRSIQRLTSTYLTLSLSDIAREAKMDNADKAELHVLKMIDAGEMQASIDESAGMVRFQEEQEDTTPALLATLNQKMAEMMAMQQRLQAASREAGLEPKYLQPSSHTEKHPKSRAHFGAKEAYGTSSAFGTSSAPFEDL